VKSVIKKTPWYIAGLHFECVQCGRCCSGPGEGYIWVTKQEIEFIADFLKMTTAELRQKYLRRVGLRTTIIEHRTTRDCIFLHDIAGQKKCMIYPVRPSQCRTWPFWSDNLTDANAWNKAAQKCPGINRGRLYSCDEIEKIKRTKKWWQNVAQTADSSEE
jgi:Fe-S-cluster containining protein